MKTQASKMRVPVPRRKHMPAGIVVGLFVVVGILSAACGTVYANDSKQETAHSQGMAPARIPETGLEAGQPEVKSGPKLELLGPAGAMAMPEPAPASPVKSVAPTDIPPLSFERLGKLENYIRNNASARKAEQLRSDPRVSSLPAQARADFLNEFGTLMFATAVPSRDWLLERTRALDHDQMEMEDRIFKYREDVATFRGNEAGLAAEIEEHNRKAASYAADLRVYQNDLAGYSGRYTDFKARLNSHNAEAAAHNAEVANYSAQCLGVPLPPEAFARCNAWQQSLNSRSSVLNNRKTQLDAERAGLIQEESGLNTRRAALQARNNGLNARYTELQSRREALEKQRGELLAEEQKLKDWQTSIQPQWDFELKQIEQWRALLDKFNERFEKALAGVNRPQSRAGWTGAWDNREQTVVQNALDKWKDGKLRSWLTENAQLNRFKSDTFSPITANGSELRFKDDFFTKISAAERENLMAFEAGKVFWNSMKDQPVERGKTLESWFVGYAPEHNSVIQDMRSARHNSEGLAWVTDYDTASQFAYLFRAQAIELEKPAGQTAQQQWQSVVRDLGTRMDRLLQDKK